MKKISLIISIATLALVAGFYHPQTTHAADCTITNAYFSDATPSGQTTPDNWYQDNLRKEVKIAIFTQDCAMKKIYVSLVHLFPGFDEAEPALDEKEFTIPDASVSSGNFEIKMKTGDKDCGNICMYYITAGPESKKDAYSSDEKVTGNLNYKRDFADFDNSKYPWEYLGNTLPTSSIVSGAIVDTYTSTGLTPVTVQTGGASLPGGGTGACAGQANCYEVSSGLGSVLNKFFGKFSVITEATSLGGFINAIIQIFIGILGLAAVVMIMYEGAKLFIAKKEGQPYSIDNAKSRIGAVLGGFILALLMYPILRTISPDLLNLTPLLEVVSLSEALDLSASQEAMKNIEDLNTSNIQIPAGDYSDVTFLMYLYHQQGPGGAPSILWAAKKNMDTIPDKTPFCCSDGSAAKINTNMQKNISNKDWANITGGGPVTPAKFLLYWRKKVEAAKQKTSPAIPNDIKSAIQQVAAELNDTNVSVANLTPMCRIESGCQMDGITAVNGKYSGLFQMGEAEFNKYGKGGGIFNIYPNIYAGARYGQANLKTYSKNLPKINE